MLQELRNSKKNKISLKQSNVTTMLYTATALQELRNNKINEAVKTMLRCNSATGTKKQEKNKAC